MELQRAAPDKIRNVYEKARARVGCTDDLKLHRKILKGLIEVVTKHGESEDLEQLKAELDSLGPVSDQSDDENDSYEENTPDIGIDIDLNEITGRFIVRLFLIIPNRCF